MLLVASVFAARAGDPKYFEIRVVDGQTGRGVPLVELLTVNHLRFVTDSAGRVAFFEPGMMNRDVYFYISSHGYEFPSDGFGYTGTRLKPVGGGTASVKLKRLNIAERLYRITGEGIYNDTILLGDKVQVANPLLNAEVLGQDSVQAAVYRNRIHWFWGDTMRLRYALGHFRTAGATSELPAGGGLDPRIGVDLKYFTNADGFSRPMCAFDPENPEPVWIDGVCVVPDEKGVEKLVSHFARMKSLGEKEEHGLIVFDDAKEEFERVATFDLKNRWRCPRGHAVRHGDFIYFGEPFLNVRVKASLAALRDPASYEMWSCVADGSPLHEASIDRDANGNPRWRWSASAEAIGPEDERTLMKSANVKWGAAFFQPTDVDTKKPVHLHAGNVTWNEFRKRWVMIAVEQGGTSFLGEVFYLEADDPAGPWLRAKKIVTHNRHSFYNPCHHAFFDQDGGRVIYFEGTYSRTFSGNSDATPRYDYNQIMYRLDLADPRLDAVRK